MKTFEERYTEWVDGQLVGDDLTAFERELARRAAKDEAHADKADAVALRGLLRSHLCAPALSNADFFSHQLGERIRAERAKEPRARAALALDRAPSWLAGWALPRFAWLGAGALFVAAALYYSAMPPSSAPQSTFAKETRPAVIQPPKVPAPAVAPEQTAQLASAATPAPPQPAAPADRSKPELMVMNDVPSPTPALPDVQTHHQDNAFSVTPMNFKTPNKDQNLQVIWTTGLPYLRDLSAPAQNNDATPASPAPPPVAP